VSAVLVSVLQDKKMSGITGTSRRREIFFMKG